MKNMKKRTGIKAVALLLAVVSGLVMTFCGVATIIFGTMPEAQMKSKDMETAFQKQILEGYGNYLLQDSGILDYDEKEAESIRWDGLDGGNIRYSVMKKDSTSDRSTVIYTNDPSIDEDSAQVVTSVQEGNNTARRVQQVSMWSLMTGYAQHYWYWTEQWRMRQIDGIVYNEEDGLFYGAGTNGNYYVLKEFFRYDRSVNFTGEGVDEESEEPTCEGYSLQEDGKDCYYSDVEGKAVNNESIQEWSKEENTLAFGDYWAAFKDNSTDNSIIEIVKSIPDEKKLQVGEYNLYSDGFIEYNVSSLTGQQIISYEVCLSATDPLKDVTWLNNGIKDYMNDVHTLINRICFFRKTSGLWTALAAFLFIGSFVFLMQAAGRRKKDDEIHVTWMDRIPYGILVLAVGLLVSGCVVLAAYCLEMFYEMKITLALGLTGMVFFVVASEFIFLIGCMSTAVRLKTHNFWNYTLCHLVCRPFRWFGRMFRENSSLSFKLGLILGGVTLLELIILSSGDVGMMMLLLFVFKIFEIPLIYRVVFQLKKILDGGRCMTNGDYSHPIDTNHMRGPIKEHANHMNNIGQGISRAVDEQMKSERFKTELITNVSHDIKTPLTSIINYVDLMEKEEIDNPKVQEYLEVLDRQSARLKKLIEDLMEASKASTGNLKVDLEKCDATVMLTQIIGEFEDRSKKNNLDIVINSPEPPANIMADGRHLWRVIDNLMSNICKYAQPETRVYIDLEKFNGMVIMTFRNISKYPLNISSEELMERFVRGDSSRNTEGSGLGLSIAQSLTTLMNGNFAIQIDGDLFKAIISFEECE